MSRDHAIPQTHLFLETSSLWVGVEAVKRKVITAYLLNLRRRFEPASVEQKRKLLNRDNASACANASAQEKSWENKKTDLYAAVVSRHSWLAKQTPYHAPTQAKKNVVRFEKLTTLFLTRWYRENAAWRQADTFATFWNDKETGAEMCPAIASGIVTEDALVSYWPMLLPIITICTRAQLHSKTISGFACVASVSVRFLSKESKNAFAHSF